MTLRPLTDKEILDVLMAINVSAEISVTTLEAELLEETLFVRGGEWTVEQRARAAKIAVKYRHQL